jgi:hypothetical protein
MRLIAIALLAVLGGCGDVTPVLDEPDVATMEVMLDHQLAVTASADGGVTGPGMRLVRNVPAELEVVFRDADGRVVANAPDFQLMVTPASIATLSFTRSGPLRGTLSGQVFGSTSVEFRLRHVSQDHDDFPPKTLGVVVQ